MLIVMQTFVGSLALMSVLLGAAAVSSAAGCSSSAIAGSGTYRLHGAAGEEAALSARR